MKNSLKALILVLSLSLFAACTPTSITDDESTPTQETYGTGGETTAEPDNERDGE